MDYTATRSRRQTMLALEARGVAKCFEHENRQMKALGGIDLAAFSHKPSRIKKIIRVDGNRPRSSNDSDLLHVQQEIRSELREKV